MKPSSKSKKHSINENYETLDEISWSGMKNVAKNFRDYARSSIGAPVGLHRRELYQFSGEFVQNAMNDLATAIEAGQVSTTATAPEPSLARTEPPMTPGAVPAGTPAAPTAPKKAPGNAPAPGATQRQTSQNINTYVQQLAKTLNSETDKNKKMALVKELVNFMADRKNYPEWQNALKTAQYIVKQGIKDPNFANAAINRLNSGQIMAEQWQVYFINKLLEATGFTWKALGLVLLKENTTKKYVIAESRYYKLNSIFESIMSEDPAAGTGESIEAYVLNWVRQYTKAMGADWAQDAQVKKLAKDVQASYGQDKGKKAFNTMANFIFSRTKAGMGPSGSIDNAAGQGAGGAGQGAGGAGQGAQSGASPAVAKTGTSVDTIINTIQSSLAKLKGIDPAMYAEIVKRIGAGKSLQGLSYSGSSAPAASAPAAAPAASAPAAAPKPAGSLPAPAARPALAAPQPQVGTTSSTGGSTFSSGGSTVHKAASGREAQQQQARAKADQERQARAAAQAGTRPRLAGPSNRLPGPKPGGALAVR